LPNGRVNVKVAPFSSELFCAHMLPPCAFTILLQIKRPSPVPAKDFVANFENSLGNISGSIPEPLSLILIMALLLSFLSLLLSLLLLLLFKLDIINIVPPGVDLIAFDRRLDITCDILILSAFRRISFGW
jgi:hypothetical protein